MTANVIPADETAAIDPTVKLVEEKDEALDDATAGKAFVFGLIGGSLLMTAVCFGLALAAGLDADIAAAVSPVPGVVAGLFFGMTIYLGSYLGRQGH